jgi:uncharacterized protein (DUF427 family)
VFDGETVADSARAKLLHETGYHGVCYFPAEDVREEYLEPTDHRTHCPIKGDARYWTVRVGERLAENAVWEYPQPLDSAPPMAGYRAFYWHEMDEWYEEDARVYGHPRDPYHRIDALPSSRLVRVRVAGETIAETARPILLFETGLPTRYYIPRADIRMQYLEPSETRTRCTYKGLTTGYWSVRVGDTLLEDAAWAYDRPKPEAAGLEGHIAFYNHQVDIEVDGRPDGAP